MGIFEKKEIKPQERQMGSDTGLIPALEERGNGREAGLPEGLCFREPVTKWRTEQGRGLFAHLCCSRKRQRGERVLRDPISRGAVKDLEESTHTDTEWVSQAYLKAKS